MEVHSHGQETLNMNKAADKVYNTELKDNLAPPSSQIPEGENLTVARGADFDHGKNETTDNFMGAIPEAAPKPSPSVAPNTTPPGTYETVVAEEHEIEEQTVVAEEHEIEQAAEQEEAFAETNFQSNDLVFGEEHEIKQAAEQEEAFDDLVILEDGMVTSATMPGGDAGYTDIQMVEDFQQAPVEDLFHPIADPSVNTANLNLNGASETVEEGRPAAEVPVNVVSELSLGSEVEISISQHTTVEAPGSHNEDIEAAIPAEDPLIVPLDSDKPGQITTEQSLPESTDIANAAANNDVPGNANLEKVITEENIQAIRGQKVLKKFGRKTFHGEVVDYDCENKWFKVVYEDGDQEELELWEVKLILASSASDIDSSGKKRPRSEGAGDESATKSSKKAKKTGAESTIKKRSKSIPKSSAKYPKTPGSRGKGSNSVSKRGKSQGKMTQKAVDSSAFKTPDSSQGTKGKGQGMIGTSTSKSGKSGSSRKRKSINKVSRSLDLQTPKTQGKGKSKTLSSVKAEDMPKQIQSGAKRKAEGTETRESAKTKRLKKGAATEMEESGKGGDPMYVGKHVEKDFGGTLYSGVVIKFNKKTQYYKVKYEDGDQEDLELHELEPILVQEAGSAEDKEDGEPTAKRTSLSALMSEADTQSPKKK